MINKIQIDQLRKNIQMLIENNKLEQARELIKQYNAIGGEDQELCTMKAVMSVMEGNISEAEHTLLDGIYKLGSNFDICYNLGYIYEVENENELALEFYKLSIPHMKHNPMKEEIEQKVEDLANSLNIDFDDKVIKDYAHIIKCIDNKNKKDLTNLIMDLLHERKFYDVLMICSYYMKHSRYSMPEMYYFLGCAYNGLEKFEQSLKYHNISLKLDYSLSNIVDFKNCSLPGSYDENIISCIGCGCEEWDIVNVSNQSIAESNKGIINPIRVWVKCRKCGLIYANPSPSEDSLNKHYSVVAKEKFGGIYGDIKNRENFLFAMSDYRLDTIARCTDKRNLLDIGTGIGVFVKAALNKGWDAYGLELTSEDCAYAKEHYGLELIQRDFYSFTEHEQYDIVTMFEVIEHLRHPQDDLIRINKIVKDGGIFVVATPILDSDYGNEKKENNAFWNVVPHLSYFTKDVLTKYIENAGFKIIKINESMEQMGRMDFYCRKVQNV